MNHRYNTRREKALMKEVDLFRGDHDFIRSLIIKSNEAAHDYGYKSTEAKDKAIRAVYSKIAQELNTHISYFQLPNSQRKLLSVFNTKAKEHVNSLEKRKKEKQWENQDLMRTRMMIGTIKTYLNNQLYIFKNTEAWLGKVIKKKKMPREIVALINTFAVGDYEDKRASYNEYYCYNAYYGM